MQSKLKYKHLITYLAFNQNFSLQNALSRCPRNIIKNLKKNPVNYLDMWRGKGGFRKNSVNNSDIDRTLYYQHIIQRNYTRTHFSKVNRLIFLPDTVRLSDFQTSFHFHALLIPIQAYMSLFIPECDTTLVWRSSCPQITTAFL